jgi:hypothetical protein
VSEEIVSRDVDRTRNGLGTAVVGLGSVALVLLVLVLLDVPVGAPAGVTTLALGVPGRPDTNTAEAATASAAALTASA